MGGQSTDEVRDQYEERHGTEKGYSCSALFVYVRPDPMCLISQGIHIGLSF